MTSIKFLPFRRAPGRAENPATILHRKNLRQKPERGAARHSGADLRYNIRV